MLKRMRLVLIGLLVLAMVMSAAMACGEEAGAETAVAAVEEFLDAYEVKDAATMDKYDAGDNKAAYETEFDAIDTIIVISVQATKVDEADTTATYRVTYDVLITVDGVSTRELKSYNMELENDGGWLITSDHMENLFPEEA